MTLTRAELGWLDICMYLHTNRCFATKSIVKGAKQIQLNWNELLVYSGSKEGQLVHGDKFMGHNAETV